MCMESRFISCELESGHWMCDDGLFWNFTRSSLSDVLTI